MSVVAVKVIYMNIYYRIAKERQANQYVYTDLGGCIENYTNHNRRE